MEPKDSSKDENFDSLYVMFFLHGHTATTVGLIKPIVSDAFLRSSFDAVAVIAINLTSLETMLRISPILKRVFLNVLPLNHYYVKSEAKVSLLTILLLCELHQSQSLLTLIHMHQYVKDYAIFCDSVVPLV